MKSFHFSAFLCFHIKPTALLNPFSIKEINTILLLFIIGKGVIINTLGTRMDGWVKVNGSVHPSHCSLLMLGMQTLQFERCLRRIQ